jgi:hypothetical protein
MIDDKTTNYDEQKNKSFRKAIFTTNSTVKKDFEEGKVLDGLYRHKKNIYDVYIDQNDYLK